MKPIIFAEANRTLAKPPTMTEEECSSLDVYADGRSCLSCWRPSWRERLAILSYGRVWLWVVSGNTQPPVSLLGSKTAFVYPTVWSRFLMWGMGYSPRLAALIEQNRKGAKGAK